MRQLIRENIRRMRGYVPGEQPKRADVIKLNTNENPYPPSPRVQAAIASAADNLRLYPDPLWQDLRRAIAALLQCDPEQVFCGNGSDEILRLCAEAFVPVGGTIGYFDPSYSLYPVLAEIYELKTCPVPLNDAFDWPENFSLEGVDLFFLTTPHAPGGRLYQADQIENLCRSVDGVVVLDEAYVDFAAQNCLLLAKALKNTLVVRSLSKSYALAGLRAGYAVGDSALIAALEKIKDSYNINRLTQAAALAAIEDQAYMRAQVAHIVKTRERLANALREMGVRVWPSATNFLWVRPPMPGAQRVYEELKARNIFVRYFPGPRTGENLRISIGTDAETDQLLAELKNILKT